MERNPVEIPPYLNIDDRYLNIGSPYLNIPYPYLNIRSTFKYQLIFEYLPYLNIAYILILDIYILG